MMRSEFLPFSRPTIEEDEIAEVVDSLRSGWLTSGPKVARFETMFTELLGVPHAVAVNSATAGLHIVLHALGVGPGDEVIVPSITWASTANMVELLGARAVFADVDADSLLMEPGEVRRLLTSKTRAVVPVHYAGAPVDLDAIAEAVDGTGVAVIEDAAHALGTTYKGREIGSSTAAAVFSFHPIKNITTGEGGMVVCRDAALAERLRLLRFHGVSKDAWRRYHQGGTPQYEIVEPGYKYNMLDLQAALGVRQLPKLARFNAERRRQAGRYDELLAGIPALRPVGRPAYPHVHAWHLYVVRLDIDQLGISRDRFIEELAAENIGTGLHFPAVHLQEYYRRRYGYGPADLPHAAAAGARILSLPLYPGLTDEDQTAVAGALCGIVERRLAIAGVAGMAGVS